ncbi:hypothetical protein [Sphingomonas oryzagri]|uniref:Uncharacterized protein n=1 Tax=Sphingomonas oryzagri TaxID=3042314 RepID=A0ABT6N1N0_9SPHN|nr:hypothetical protein [Sphingomonas oryzagri]MDH7638966.1 hypothetical protein [Sphingomonas oryzagri]
MNIGTGITLLNSTGDTTYPPLLNDAVDLAVVSLGQSKIFSYARPKDLVAGLQGYTNPNANFADRLNQPVLVGANGAGTGTTQILSATDAGFNGKPSIDCTSAPTGPYFLNGQPPAAFTFMAPIRINDRSGTHSLYSIFGANADASGYNAIFAAADVRIGVTWASGSQTDVTFTGKVPALNTTSLVLLSHDPVAKQNRFIVNDLGTVNSGTSPDGLTTSSTAVAHPFGYVSASAGVPLAGKHGGWLIANQAYQAGDSAFDAKIAAIFAAWKTLLGIS